MRASWSASRYVFLAIFLAVAALPAGAQNIRHTELCGGKRPPVIVNLPPKERAEFEKQIAALKDHIDGACEQAEMAREQANLSRTPVHDTADADPERTHKEMVVRAAFTPDGRHIVSVSTDLTLRLWDVATGRQLRAIAHFPKPPVDLALSPDGRQVAVSIDEQDVRLIEIETGKETGRIPPSNDDMVNRTRPVAFDGTGRLLTATDLKTVAIFPPGLQGNPIRLGGHDEVRRIVVSDVARLIATMNYEGTVYLWDLASGRRLDTIPGKARDLAFSPDGTTLAIGSADGLFLRDIASRHSSRLIARNIAFNLFSLAFTRDGKGLITGRWHPELWNAETGERLRHFGPFSDLAHSLAVSPDGKYLLTTHLGSDLRLWEIETGTFFRRFGRNVLAPN